MRANVPVANKIVVPRAENGVVRVTVAMYVSTLKRLKIDGITRGLSVSDLVAEALSQRPVDPIHLDSPAETALRRIASAAPSAPMVATDPRAAQGRRR